MGSSSANRIAKNTIFLYLRSFILMAISIYTSRVILDILGVENYGIYNLVGGVVALFSSLRGVFSSAIQRFINYTRGKGDVEGVHHIFSLSIIIQFGLALFFLLVVESFGMWFIPNKLVIPNGMLDIALFVFHCSIASATISILGVPYDAAVIANEKMNFYAYVSIAEAALKLCIIFILPFLPFELLRSYAILVLALHVFIVGAKVFYCQQFPECKFEKYWNLVLFKQLASFSGWNFFGNITYSLIQEGTNFILNMFAGVVANAARGIAAQVRSAIDTLSNNLYTASKPFIMQQAASVEKQSLFNYIYILSRVIFYVILITTVPVIAYAEQIMGVWLVEIPNYAVSFVRMIMVFELVRSLHSPIVMLFFSVGKLKRFQLTEAFVGLFTLPLVYLFLYLGLPLYTAFGAMTIIEAVNLIAILLVAHKEIGFSLLIYIKRVILKCTYATGLVSLLSFVFFHLTMTVNKYVALLWLILLVICSVGIIYMLVLNKEEKQLIQAFLLKMKKGKK